MAADLPAAWWGLIKQVATSWLDDYVPSMGAALAYYTMFSLAPLLLIVVSVARLVFGEDTARSEIQAQLPKSEWVTLVRARLMAFGQHGGA